MTKKQTGHAHSCPVCGHCWDGSPAGVCPCHIAARDLLAACETALAYLEVNRPKGNIRANFSAINQHENAVVKPLRAAIAKAQGGAA